MRYIWINSDQITEDGNETELNGFLFTYHSSEVMPNRTVKIYGRQVSEPLGMARAFRREEVTPVPNIGEELYVYSDINSHKQIAGKVVVAVGIYPEGPNFKTIVMYLDNFYALYPDEYIFNTSLVTESWMLPS